jgi:hypothetical protein
MRRAAAVHELEQLVEIDALLMGEVLREIRAEAGAQQPALAPVHPSLPIAGGVAGGV